MIKAGIIGGAGYTAGELMRLLVNHPHTDLCYVHSTSQAGKEVTEVHRDLLGETDLRFESGAVPSSLEVLFLCVGHGKSRQFLKKHSLNPSTRLIDFSQDHRLQVTGDGFVYGLPELNRHLIAKTSKVANPGCFATAIQLALLPLAAQNLLMDAVQVHAITGSTGAGASPLPTTHFSWRHNNLSVYKAFDHQHLDEIHQSLRAAGNKSLPEVNFIPVRGDFTKGIFCTAFTYVEGNLKQFEELYTEYYREHPFTRVSLSTVSLKEVINTNKCHLHLQYHGGKLLVTSILDNLLKGASGQAVQNMNIMFELPEETGLQLKATGF